MQEQWQACVDRLSGEMSEPAHKTYIKPLVYLGFDPEEGVVRLGAPSRMKLDIVRKQFSHNIGQVVRECFAAEAAVRFEICSTPASRTVSASKSPRARAQNGLDEGDAPDVALADESAAVLETGVLLPADGSAPDRLGTALDRSNDASVPATEGGRGFGAIGARTPDDRTKLLADLTFANFVTGKANEVARAAAASVADRPGGAYNPLFLYGGVGLGKTHQMHAVGNGVLARVPDAAVRYVSANQFFQDMVQALRRDSVEQFKRYYQSLDLLLIDDIQFLSEKKRTQEEFFYVFESLVANHRQILISSDTYPNEMSGIEDRLISRFNSGLIAAIEPPELEMRVAILLRKAESVKVRLPEDVAFFVAKHIRQNVRELEGALARIIHFASFRSSPIEIELVKEALRDLLSYNRGQISIEIIQRAVADYFKIKLADMYSNRRPARIALPRQIAMYLAKELTQKSLPEIGEAFGGRDHTTVLYAVRKIAEQRRHQSELNHQIHLLEQTLKEYL